jgi:hypothetical protein
MLNHLGAPSRVGRIGIKEQSLATCASNFSDHALCVGQRRTAIQMDAQDIVPVTSQRNAYGRSEAAGSSQNKCPSVPGRFRTVHGNLLASEKKREF